MATFVINRQHSNPDNEEHAAMCWQQERVTGDLKDAKLVALRMILLGEDKENTVYFLAGLVMLDTMPESGFVSWTDGRGIRWSISTGR